MRSLLTSRIGEVLELKSLPGNLGHFTKKVVSTVVSHYSRTMVEYDVWQNVPGYGTAPSPWLLCVVVIPFLLAYPISS
jgi:hypothetical protein